MPQPIYYQSACLLTLFLPGEGGISPLIVCHVTKSVRNRVNNSWTFNSGWEFDCIYIGCIAKCHNHSYLKVCLITWSNLKTKHYTGRFLHDLCESLHLPAISWHYIHVKKLQETHLSDFYDYKSNVFKQTGPLGWNCLKWTRTLPNLAQRAFNPRKIL